MYIGRGIVLLVLSLILELDVIAVDLKYVNEDDLGAIRKSHRVPADLGAAA